MTTHPHPPLTPFGSALAGALGSVFANAVVYPLDTVKTRLQALDEEEIELFNKDDGNGDILPSDDVEKGDLADDKLATSIKNEKDGDNQIERLKRSFRRRMKHWGMLTLLLKILKNEGLAGAFHGFGASMLGSFSQQFAYFFFHTFLRTNYINRLSTNSSAGAGVKGTPVQASRASLSTGAELLLGALAGALAQIFTIPVNVIATRQQLWQPGPLQKDVAAPTLLETANEIISEDGIKGLWTGLKPGLVLTVNPAITYGVFERLKSWKLKARPAGAKLEVAEAFWLGVGSKTLATVVTYPYIFAKVRLQAKYADDPSTPAPPSSTSTSTSTQSPTSQAPSYASVASLPPPSFGDASTSTISADPSSTSLTHPTPVSRPVMGRKHSHHPHHSGAIALLKDIYKEKGLRGWYKGLGAQVLKAVLCQGITFVSKDQFESYAYLLIVLFARLRKID